MPKSGFVLPPAVARLRRTSPCMPLRLLVSVRDAEEAQLAVEFGVDAIDAKEPDRGALGKADDATLRQIADVVRGKALLSYAGGEALDFVADAQAAERLAENAQAGYALCKFGPAGLAAVGDWRRLLKRAWEVASSAGASPVAVAYVDHVAAQAPAPEAIAELALESGCAGLLFDTFGKAPRLGLNALPSARLRDCIAVANAAGMLVTLAGSLGPADAPEVRRLQADLLAVRGAVCAGERTSRLDADRLADMQSALARDARQAVEFDASRRGSAAIDRRGEVDLA